MKDQHCRSINDIARLCNAALALSQFDRRLMHYSKHRLWQRIYLQATVTQVGNPSENQHNLCSFFTKLCHAEHGFSDFLATFFQSSANLLPPSRLRMKDGKHESTG
jgi:hypothetical protein